MSIFSSSDGVASDAVRLLTGSPEFAADGVVLREAAGVRLAVVDPARRPLEVWCRERPAARSYVATARALNAAVVTNGPMMGRRLWPGIKQTRPTVFAEVAGAAVLGGLGGAALLRVRPGHTPARTGSALLTATVGAGALSASLGVWTAAFRDWTPCGAVAGAAAPPPARASFDGEGPRHSWIGRAEPGFSNLMTGFGRLPPGIVEGLGGLLMLVQDGIPVAPRSEHVTPLPIKGADAGSDLGALGAKPGIAAWALVPLSDDPEHGVLVVLASAAMCAHDAAALLAGLGARSAVGMDQGGAVMFGSGTELSLTPAPHRQAMQTYGLCCR